MGIAKVCCAYRKCEVLLLRQLKACRHMHIVRRKPQNTGNDRFIRTMSLPGFGKGAVQQDLSIYRCIL